MKLATLFLVSFFGTAMSYAGDMTYFEPGLGSCGYTSSPTDSVVALSVAMMNNPANPNDNPKCGSSINIYNPATGSLTPATVVDTCQACAYEDVDVSPGVFETVVPEGLGVGRVKVDWGGDVVGGKERMGRRMGRRRGVEWSG